MRRLFAFSGMAILFLSACGAAPVQKEIVINRGLDAGAILVGPTSQGHVYALHGRGADRFPAPRLLFFASDDVFSKDTDAELQEIYKDDAVHASTFRIDFQTATGTRLEYKVLLPDSIVLVTASGANAPIIHPSSEQLRSILLPPTPELL